MKRKMLVLLMTLGLYTATALPVSARGQLPPNYPAAHDGYAPADYDGDGKTDLAVKSNTQGVWKY